MRAWLERADQVDISSQRIERNSEERVRELELEGRDLQAISQAQAAANGVQWDEGSPLEIQGAIAGEFEKRIAIDQTNTAWAVDAHLVEADNMRKHATNVFGAAQQESWQTLLTSKLKIKEMFDGLVTGPELFMQTARSAASNYGSSFGGGALSSGSGGFSFGSLFGGRAGQTFGSGFSNQGTLLTGNTGALGGGV